MLTKGEFIRRSYEASSFIGNLINSHCDGIKGINFKLKAILN